MKLLIKSVCAAFVLSVIFSMIPFSAQCEDISDKVFRLHILANSDSKADQELKLRVRDRILEYTRELYKGSESVKEAERLTDRELKNIADIAKTEVERQGFSYTVRAEIRRTSFDTRNYDRVIMPSGNYNSLRIVIGEGKGHNWWCVMYPSLCVGASADYDELRDKTDPGEYNLLTGGYTVKFKIVEIFNSICGLFS